jgi:hypothetical protein
MRRVRASRLVPVCLGLAVVTAALALFDPATTWWFPSCPFHAMTGLLCPFCGSLRAIHALLRGAPLAALAFNPLVIVGGGMWVVARERTAIWCSGPRGPMLLAAFTLLRNL